MKFHIFNVETHGIKSALIRAGYPMATWVNERMDLDNRTIEQILEEKPFLKALGNSPIGHGDDKFLRQCLVSFDVMAPRFWWAQMDTYGVFTVKNSQSTMHKGKSLDYDRIADPYVDRRILDLFKGIVEDYYENPTAENFLRMKSNMPEGICLVAGITTNYAQLRTIYFQRRNHRLPQWQDFCDWIETLPYVEELGVISK